MEGKTITMFPVGAQYMFVYGFTTKAEMVFRVSSNIKFLQKEKVEFKEGQVFTALHHIPLYLLRTFITEKGELITNDKL